MTDAPADPGRHRPLAFATVLGVVLCALVAHRQAERDALRLGSAPVAAAAPLPRTMVVPRRPLGDPAPPAPPPAPTGSGTDAEPRRPPSRQGDDRARLERLGVEVFSEQRPAILRCLREERALRPGVAGKLEIRVDVDDQGLVWRVTLGESPVRSPSFDECARLSAAQLVFPPELAGRDVSIVFDLR